MRADRHGEPRLREDAHSTFRHLDSLHGDDFSHCVSEELPLEYAAFQLISVHTVPGSLGFICIRCGVLTWFCCHESTGGWYVDTL